MLPPLQWAVMLPISVEMDHLMYTLLSVLVMECGNLTLTLLWTVQHQVYKDYCLQYLTVTCTCSISFSAIMAVLLTGVIISIAVVVVIVMGCAIIIVALFWSRKTSEYII